MTRPVLRPQGSDNKGERRGGKAMPSGAGPRLQAAASAEEAQRSGFFFLLP